MAQKKFLWSYACTKSLLTFFAYKFLEEYFALSFQRGKKKKKFLKCSLMENMTEAEKKNTTTTTTKKHKVGKIKKKNPFQLIFYQYRMHNTELQFKGWLTNMNIKQCSILNLCYSCYKVRCLKINTVYDFLYDPSSIFVFNSRSVISYQKL